MDCHQLLWRAHAHGIKHGFLNQWVATLQEVLTPMIPGQIVAEIAPLGGDFLHLLYLHSPYGSAAALGLDGECLASSFSHPAHIPIHFDEDVNSLTAAGGCSLVFSFETLSLVDDLTTLAQRIERLLAPGGCCYMTLAWHRANPCVKRVVALRAEKQQPCYLYSLDQVATAFHEVGLEVGLKRLRPPFFLMFSPTVIKGRYGDVDTMIESVEDHTVILSFRKEPA